MVTTMSGHPIVAVFFGDDYSASSTSSPLIVPAIINAVGVGAANIAPGELVSLFGANLSTTTAVAATLPLPNSLARVSAVVTDSLGVAHPAALSYVSASQINFLVPTETAQGNAALVVSGANGMQAIPVNVEGVAPGIFSSGESGGNVAAAQILPVGADGTQTLEGVVPSINLGGDTVYLLLYGTGIRNRITLSNVACMIGSLKLAVDYAGPQSNYPGLDQINVFLPGALAGAGQVKVFLTVDGQVSNAVTLVFQ